MFNVTAFIIHICSQPSHLMIRMLYNYEKNHSSANKQKVNSPMMMLSIVSDEALVVAHHSKTVVLVVNVCRMQKLTRF